MGHCCKRFTDLKDRLGDRYDFVKNEIYLHPICQHIKLLAAFIAFKVVLPLADVFTDLRTAETYFAQDDYMWAMCTIGFVFLPLVGRILKFISQVLFFLFDRDYNYPTKAMRLKLLLKTWPEIVWQIPPLPVIKNLRLFFSLLTMDTSLPKNQALILQTKEESLDSGFFESYLESAPQLIFQCSLILRTGITNKTQVLSIIVSLISLTLSSVRLYYSQRVGRHLDVSPTFKMVIYAAPAVAVQLLFPLYSLVLMTAYAREHTIWCIFILWSLNFIPIWKSQRYNYRPLYRIYGGAIKRVMFGIRDRDRVFLTAILTSIKSPCTVWSNCFMFKSNFLLVTSFTSLTLHAFTVVGVSLTNMYADLSTISNPPITYCTKELNVTLFSTYQIYPNFNAPLLNFCNIEDRCKPVLRICDGTSFVLYIGIIGAVLLSFSLMASVWLFYQGHYANMYVSSKILLCGFPIIHPTLIRDNVTRLMEEQHLLERYQKRIQETAKSNKKAFLIKDRISGNSLMEKNINDYLNEDQIENIMNKMKKRTGKVWNIPPLLYCLQNNDQLWYTILLLLGSNHKAGNECGETPFKTWAKKLTEMKEFSKFDAFLVRWVLTNDEWLELMTILSENKSKFCLKFLLDCRRDVHVWKTAQKTAGETPLHIACQSSHLEVIGQLFDLGADVNARNCWGNTPLIVGKSYPITAKLMEHNQININLANNKQQTPLILRAQEGYKAVVELLLARGASVNLTDEEGRTALHWTALGKLKTNNDCLQLLINHGADLAIRDKNGQIALHLAAKFGRMENLELLISKGSEVSAMDNCGNTPLHLATEVDCKVQKKRDIFHVHAKWKCHKFLLEKGADQTIRNSKNETPMESARIEFLMSCNPEAIEKLRARPSKENQANHDKKSKG